ncbi:MAG: WGR domain-containing protein [Archangium sp.]
MKRLLHATHPEPKFWEVSVVGSEVTLRTGPMHTPGSTRTIPAKSDEAALKMAQQLIEQRLRDGFRDAAEVASTAAVMTLEQERQLLLDSPDAWLVFADSLMESTERLRGELIGLQVRVSKKERGSVGKTKTFVKEHFDALVGAPLAAFHKQVTIDWRFGYARSVRVWSGPHNAPIGDVLEALLMSPACRFLQKLEFGSPGTEGKYDAMLRALAKLNWPAHLDSLFLGNFDVEAARAAGSAWPRMESLGALLPVADRLRSLEVRAVLNTLGKGLAFPKLEKLVLMPATLDARLMTDVLTLEAPRLREFGLGSPEQPRTGWDGWGRFVRQQVALSALECVSVLGQNDGLGLIADLVDVLPKLKRVELNGAVRASDSARVITLAPALKNVVVALEEPASVVKALQNAGVTVDETEPDLRAPKSSTRRVAPPRARQQYEEDRYDEIGE